MHHPRFFCHRCIWMLQYQTSNKKLNPVPRDMYLGFTLEGSSGESAKRKVTKQKLSMLDGDVNTFDKQKNGKWKRKT